MRFLKKLLKYFFYLILLLLILALVYLWRAPVPAPQSAAVISSKVKALHETASIWVPHLDIDKGELRAAHLPLFEKVERGQTLTEEEGKQYRQLYQQLLLENQTFFSHFDSQLAAITDLGMDQHNNVGGLGIEGHHDHHDQSSRNNFDQIEKSFEFLKFHSVSNNNHFSLGRIKHAIFIYKNMNDILFHLATVPHTKSINYHPLAGDLSLGRKLFESMLLHFKAAQFLEVNSDEYKKEIALALNEYRDLVLISEAMVQRSLSPLELKVVGSWGGWQSLTSKVSDKVNKE